MTHRPSNRLRNRRTVELMNLQPDMSVLEIGCGPGLALQQCADLLEGGRAIGIDHSPVMIEQAAARLGKDIEAGRVELIEGGLPVLDDLPGRFDRIYSLNVVQFLSDLEEAFALFRRHLAPGGACYSTYQPRGRKPSNQDAIAKAHQIESAMRAAGFGSVETVELFPGKAPALCVFGLA